ncbi:HlyD family efflux transporter periplasmic adaptor subunit [Tissierella creatinophila]|uniref:HlyD family secretion protein n=1 Tax=Tissierella creatinophila DSM 6911 TaxID=1123403 RepID=A0A1U7M365_TISCR|nr:HlyD family efflux transporter periplasmic adaptor subunit [Tissierella creatinophila]OLS01690.1 HlyD family secretion protein [Tissierella creatinophila DSM 6911]
MSYEQRNINRQKREKRHRFMIIGLSIILLIVLLFSLFNKKTKTISPLEDTFLKEINLQGALIKNEKVFKISETEDIDLSVLEGKRVPIGTRVGNATLLNDLKTLRNELKQVENAISTLKKSNKDEVFKNDKKKLIENYTILIERLQQNIYIENYKEIENIKKEIILTNKQIKDLSPQNNLLGQSIESLSEKKEELKNSINQKDSSYTTKFAGIISYKIDGYENIFKPQGFENYTYDTFTIPEEEIDDNGEIKTPKEFKGFKIIDNFQWYLAIKIENRKDINDYTIGDILYVKYPIKGKELEIEGKVISINNSSNKSVIILKFNKYLHDFYNARFPKVKLVQEKIEGLKIPNSTIFEQDGEKGVYIKDFSGIVKFRPIKTIATRGEYTYIDKGDKDTLISIDTKKDNVRTISIYDEILLNPHRFKENQILD